MFELATSESGSAAHFALPAQHCVYLESGRAAERRSRLENRAHRAMLFWDANQTFRKLGLARLASMSFRRRSVWIAWLLPKPKVLELPGHSAFNRT